MMHLATRDDQSAAMGIAHAAIMSMPDQEHQLEWADEFVARVPDFIEDGCLWVIDGVAIVVREEHWVEAVFVHPKVQRQGIGRAIAKMLVEQGRAEGLDYLEGHANPTALSFYNDLGLKDLGPEQVTSPTGIPFTAHRVRMDL